MMMLAFYSTILFAVGFTMSMQKASLSREIKKLKLYAEPQVNAHNDEIKKLGIYVENLKSDIARRDEKIESLRGSNDRDISEIEKKLEETEKKLEFTEDRLQTMLAVLGSMR